MRIVSEIIKNENIEMKYDSYLYLRFIPEDDCYDHDVMFIGRLTTYLEKAKAEYEMVFGAMNKINHLKVHESHFMKFLSKYFWYKDNV